MKLNTISLQYITKILWFELKITYINTFYFINLTYLIIKKILFE